MPTLKYVYVSMNWWQVWIAVDGASGAEHLVAQLPRDHPGRRAHIRLRVRKAHYVHHFCMFAAIDVGLGLLVAC